MGVVLVAIEGLVYIGAVLTIASRQWGRGTDNSGNTRAEDGFYLAEAVHLMTGLMIAALVFTALALWRRAFMTAVLQVLAVLALLVMLVQTNHHYDVTHPKPAPPNTGPVCYSGSNNCPDGG